MSFCQLGQKLQLGQRLNIQKARNKNLKNENLWGTGLCKAPAYNGEPRKPHKPRAGCLLRKT